jgi:hypothetical protein
LGDPGAGGQEAVGSTKLLIEARPAACYPFEVISMNPEIKSKKLYRSRTDSELAGVCGGMEWYNEPPVWKVEGDVKDDTIHITSGQKLTSGVRLTYGFIRDNGHFFIKKSREISLLR